MYSRYTPNPKGGFNRRQLPDEADLRAAQGRAPPSVPEQNQSPPPPSVLAAEETPGAQFKPHAPVEAESPGPPPRPMRFRPAPPRRPTSAGAGFYGPQPAPSAPVGAGSPGPSSVLGGMLGPNGLLGQLLPHGLDSEDLLILAVLLLSMKQDGASPTELLIAVGLYFWL
ncbi:MAG: hypothetical protein IIY94_01330 [Oscillospiraceae bacterium]|nr:hypothetical protein [Oscillospiraceae bacterium]